MPNSQDLRQWLLHHVDDLSAMPDMITDAAHGTTRFRWHDVAYVQGANYGIGINLHAGPAIGGIWMYGNGLVDVALHPWANPRIPMHIRPGLVNVLQNHIANRGYYDDQNEWMQGFLAIDNPFG
jgi:hypothetical protein